MNLQSIIDNAKSRGNAIAELKLAILELDPLGLEEILVYVSELVRVQPTALQVLEDAHQKKETAKKIARAEKGVRTRKRNAAAKKRNVIAAKVHEKPKPKPKPTKMPQARPMAPKLKQIVDYVIDNPGLSAITLDSLLDFKKGTASTYLTAAKKEKRVYNEDGKWFATQRQKNLANGAAVTP